jgi:PilZ domain
MESSASPRQERRKTPRTQLQQIVYVNLESDNGGIVVDLSAGGLSFRSATPVKQAPQPYEPLGLRFSLPNGQRLEASAEIVWTGQTRKIGGLRFTNLSEVARAQILSLIEESAHGARPSPASNSAPPIAQLPAHPSFQPPVQPPVQQLTAVLPRLSPLPTQKPPERPHLPVGRFPTGDPSEYTHLREPWPPPPQDTPSSFRGVAIGFIAAALLAAAGWLFHSHRRDLGALMVQWGEQLQGASPVASQSPLASPAPPSLPPPSPEQSSPSAVPAPQPSAAPASSATENPAPPEPASKPERALRASSGATRSAVAARAPASPDKSSASNNDDAEADLAAARRYLNGIGRSRNSAVAAQLLWAAVAKGNSAAELTLADLYLNGDGVAKSCEQAGVLLRAASDKGDSQAGQILAQLSRNPCR